MAALKIRGRWSAISLFFFPRDGLESGDVMTILESERLVLRPPLPVDVTAMTVWLGDYEVSKTLARVPHPFGETDAEDFIAGVGPWDPAGRWRFAITRKSDGLYLGGCGLAREGDQVELGYWLGRPFWGQGFASEAASRLLRFAFETLRLDSVHAGWFADNPASGHVLAKLGARHAGSALRACLARGEAVLCHDMRLTRQQFLRKEAA